MDFAMGCVLAQSLMLAVISIVLTRQVRQIDRIIDMLLGMQRSYLDEVERFLGERCPYGIHRSKDEFYLHGSGDGQPETDSADGQSIVQRKDGVEPDLLNPEKRDVRCEAFDGDRVSCRVKFDKDNEVPVLDTGISDNGGQGTVMEKSQQGHSGSNGGCDSSHSRKD